MTTRTTGPADGRIVDDLPVPFVDLGIQHRQVAVDVELAMNQVMETTSFVLGPAVQRFEASYADFCGSKHCIGVGNGTDAIELALRAAGIGTGDEVVIPANTFVATAEAVLRAGASLALADCREDYLLDPDAVASAVTVRTRAVIAVDLYGQVAPMEEIRAAVKRDVVLIEDAAQSQGATRHGQPAGSFGLASATSFYPGKNLGAYGDAGAVTTSDDEVGDHIRALRSHGGLRRYEHDHIGTNSRLDSLQAAVLEVKLRRLREWNEERRQAAMCYQELLGSSERLVLPEVAAGNQHVWHLYVVQVDERDRVLSELAEDGISAGIHYPTPVHRLPAFSPLELGRGRNLGVAERTAARILSLPLFPGITVRQQERVAESLLRATS